MMQIATVVGARPQFVKAAVVSRLVRSEFAGQMTEYIIHTGQHYDHNMSRVFFEEMDIPEPDINLGVGSGSHGEMTGKMLIAIERIFKEMTPDVVVVYGDTNSTLAGALAASKLLIPVAHVEAGLRSANMRMPEEQNRILTDHISSKLYCPTYTAVHNLETEGLGARAELVGDVMFDALLYYGNPESDNSRSERVLTRLGIQKPYYLLTIHRAENTDDASRLRNIVSGLNRACDISGILPIHPRTARRLDQLNLRLPRCVRTIEPVGYKDMLVLERESEFVVTDSGGVQKEAFLLQKPCITLRNETEWTETLTGGWNTLVGAEQDRIARAISSISSPPTQDNPFGDGDAARRILRSLTHTYR